MATVRAAALSVDGPTIARTFQWMPRSDKLVFIDGDAICAIAEGRTYRLGPARALGPVEALGGQQGSDIHRRIVRISPDGRFMAVGIGRATGVFSMDGRLVRVIPASFRAWAGSTGVLAVTLHNDNPSLFLYDIKQAGSRLVYQGFKQVVVTDPSGRWFAHPSPTANGRAIWFWRPNGSLLARISLSFRPQVLEGISADGGILGPSWP